MVANKVEISEICARLRSIRQARGWSLHDVERNTQGRLKAVVLGSYERGSRTLSVPRAIEIAELYEVPITSIFTSKASTGTGVNIRLILDLRALSRRCAEATSELKDRCEVIARFTKGLLHARQDWNGEVISLRESDLSILALLVNLEPDELASWFDSERILLQTRSRN